MFRLPQEAGILNQFAPAFTQPTFERFLTLLVGAIVTMGRRTVSHVLFSIPGLRDGHCSSYSRLFSASRWSLWPLARVLAKAVVALAPEDQPLIVDVDDTIAGHSGRKVFGVGMIWRCFAIVIETAFADALAAVRTLLWKQVILLHAPGGRLVTQLPNPVQDWLLAHLAAAA